MTNLPSDTKAVDAQQLEAARGQRARWRLFLADLEGHVGLERGHADLVRACWEKLRGAEPDLPLPMADRTADEAAFQFAWSYAHVLLEVEVSSEGEIYWYGKDLVHGESEDESVGAHEPIPPELASWLGRAASAC